MYKELKKKNPGKSHNVFEEVAHGVGAVGVI